MEKIVTTLSNGQVRIRDYDVDIAIANEEDFKVTHEGKTMTLTVDQLINNILSKSPIIPSMYGGPAYCLLGYAWVPDVKVFEQKDLVVKEELKTSKMIYKVKEKKEIVTIEEVEKEYTLMEYIGMKAIEYREALGLTQAKLSQQVGSNISASNISRIESGNLTGKNTAAITLNTLQDLAQALGVHITDLLPPKEE